jgi:hypothetical protein
MPKLSEDFERAFSSGCGGCRRTCHCGREYYDFENEGYGWEEGELEELNKRADEEPGKVRGLPYSVGTMIVDGSEFVMGCDECAERLTRYERFIWNHRRQIIEYLKRKCERIVKNEGEVLKTISETGEA